MEYLNNKVKEINRLEKQLEYNFVMALLLVIEQCYLENDNITGISSNSKKKNDNNKSTINEINDLLNIGNISFIDSEGFEIEKEDINYNAISYLNNVKEFIFYDDFERNEKSLEYKNIIKDIFKDFTDIKNRKNRYSLYEKHMHGRIPNYNNILNDWKNEIFNESIKEYENIPYVETLSNLKLNEDIKKLTTDNIKISYIDFKTKNNNIRLLKNLISIQDFVDKNNELEGFKLDFEVSGVNHKEVVLSNLSVSYFIMSDENHALLKKEDSIVFRKMKSFNIESLKIKSEARRIYSFNQEIKNVGNIFDFIKGNENLNSVLNLSEDEFATYKSIYEKEKISEKIDCNNSPKITKRL